MVRSTTETVCPQTEGPSIVPSEATDTVTEEINQFLASAEENK